MPCLAALLIAVWVGETPAEDGRSAEQAAAVDRAEMDRILALARAARSSRAGVGKSIDTSGRPAIWLRTLLAITLARKFQTRTSPGTSGTSSATLTEASQNQI